MCISALRVNYSVHFAWSRKPRRWSTAQTPPPVMPVHSKRSVPLANRGGNCTAPSMPAFSSFFAVSARSPSVLVRLLSCNEPNYVFRYVQLSSVCFKREAVKYAVRFRHPVRGLNWLSRLHKQVIWSVASPPSPALSLRCFASDATRVHTGIISSLSLWMLLR
jgi:hypothetical protein